MQTFDIDQLTFTDPSKGKDNKYFIGFHEPIHYQFNNIVLEKDENKSIEVSISKVEDIELIKDIESKIIKITEEKAPDWFAGKTFTDNYFETAFLSALTTSKKPHLKLIKYNKFAVYNNAKEIVKDGMKINDKVNIIIEPQGIWFSKTRFGVTFKLKQAKLRENNKIQTCLFEDDEPEDVFPFEE